MNTAEQENMQVLRIDCLKMFSEKFQCKDISNGFQAEFILNYAFCSG